MNFVNATWIHTRARSHTRAYQHIPYKLQQHRHRQTNALDGTLAQLTRINLKKFNYFISRLVVIAQNNLNRLYFVSFRVAFGMSWWAVRSGAEKSCGTATAVAVATTVIVAAHTSNDLLQFIHINIHNNNLICDLMWFCCFCQNDGDDESDENDYAAGGTHKNRIHFIVSNCNLFIWWRAYERHA